MFEQLTDNIRLLFQKEKEPFLRLRNILGFLPHDISLYRMALRHKSLVETDVKKASHKVNNERLEFLGDAVLGTVVADILYYLYPSRQEGYLTTLRSKIVCRDSLNKLAVKMGLDKLVLHDDRIAQAHNSYMNGNAFEAFVGAIYLDRGYDYCYRFMKDVVFVRYIDIEQVSKVDVNYKSKLIEWCQKYQLEFSFELVSQKILADHNTPKFSSRVVIEGVYSGNGEGYSKKESHQNAARQALQHIKRDRSFVNSLLEARRKRKGEIPTEESKDETKEPDVNEQPSTASRRSSHRRRKPNTAE